MTTTTKPKPFKLVPIGTVHQSEEGFWLDIEPTYRLGLKEMDQFSHVYVLWWADRLDKPEYRGVLQANLPYAKGTKAGVFACRAEYRPNPIGVTICPLLDVDEHSGIVHLAFIDALDGTPVLDLKPYIPMADRFRDVKVASWMKDWPDWVEDAAEYFTEHAVTFN